MRAGNSEFSVSRLFKCMLFDIPEADTFSFERELVKQGLKLIAGTDEAGRGPLAGPVVAACVVLPSDCEYHLFKDSKKLSPASRKKLYAELKKIAAHIGIGIISAAEIDKVNILQASLLAMKKALHELSVAPDYLLVDGKFAVPVSTPQKTLIKGESRSASIAAASIVAKVTRDAMMEEYHLKYPMYNFQQHKGYPTAEHRKCIQEHGPCEIHRRSFKGVSEFFR